MFLEAVGTLAARLLFPAIRRWPPLTVALISICLLAQFGAYACVTGHRVLERPWSDLLFSQKELVSILRWPELSVRETKQKLS